MSRYLSAALLALASSAVCPPQAAAQTRDYFVESRSYGTQPEHEPPRYVRTLSETGYEQFKDLYWLEGNADFRTRYEYRSNDFRRDVKTVDEPFLLRARTYMGIKDILDPFRFAFEFEDARSYNSRFDRSDRDVNAVEFVQLYGELYFDDALGEERPLSVKVGRHAYEVLDRRLIGRNEWRNTTNTFQGVRMALGQRRNDWQLDLHALQPIQRRLYDIDRADDRQWFFGGIGHIRRYSDIVTLQPFYLGLHQDGDGAGIADRMIHSPGLRGYGLIGDSGFDYDLQLVYQFGRSDGEDHEAWGGVAELGYSPEHAWKPRFSVNYGFATGDRDPNDDNSERFERFFGFARPWSSNDYFQWENLHAPKLRVEFQPLPKLRLDSGYSWYWLASDTDRWNNGNLRDASGQSGDFLGHEFDIRARYPLARLVDANIGYAHFESGGFVERAGRGGDSDFFYLELTVRLFE